MSTVSLEVADPKKSSQRLQQRVCYDQLPLAVYREIAAHLQQIAGVKTTLISQSAQTFDYAQSQIEALEIDYPEDLSPSEKSLLAEILAYYEQRYSTLR
ncbi:MAG: hypothetical protein ACRC6M_20010 [Microcystaceae cyanobacterium]